MVAVAVGMAAVDAGEAVAGFAVAVVADGEAAGSGMTRGDVDKTVEADYSQARQRRRGSRCLEVPLMARVVADDSCCRVGERELAVGGGN
jgi:hypothetical protein